MASKSIYFDKTELKTFSEKKQFKSPLRERLSEEEQCLIDNVWDLPTTPQGNGKKVACLNALLSYFHTGKQFQKKPFACYALYTGDNAGVYLDWSEMTTQIEEVKKNPRLGTPMWKGFFDCNEAINSLKRGSGDIDFVISPKVLKYLDFLSHLEKFEDQDFLKEVNDFGASSKGKEVVLKPQTLSLKNSFKETLKTSTKTLAQKEVLVFQKPKTQAHIPKNPEPSREELNLNTFILLQEFLAQISNNQITQLGISTTWEFSYNPFKFCNNQFEDCPNNQEGECFCKLDSAIRKARISIPTFKPLKFREINISTNTLIRYGLIDTINTQPLHEFTSYLPMFLAETMEIVMSEVPRKTKMVFHSLYPDFQKGYSSYHLIELYFKGLDDEYEEFQDSNIKPRTLKMEETIDKQLDLVRAKIIAEDFSWSKMKFCTKNILREDNLGKIYCDSTIAAKYFFPFEVSHSRPRLVESYRKRRTIFSEEGRPSSSESSS